jgi:tagatose 6-phosphate kinase
VLVVACLNPAVDVTLTVDRLCPGESHRARMSMQRAGGKGVNVAHVLHQLGVPVVLTGFVGGPRGAAVGAGLDPGLRAQFVDVGDETRQTVTIVDAAGAATVVNEPGPAVTVEEWARFVDTFGALLREADAVVLSGSLPRGVPSDAYAQLTRAAHAAGRTALVDAAGEALRAALDAEPDLVKPNEDEAAPFGTDGSAVDGLVAAGARNAVVSRGARGLAARVGEHRYDVTLARPVTGNPTGAGDALAAGLARGLSTTDGWPAILREATALAAAAVAVPYAGAIDLAVLDQVRPLVQVREV